ncbi:hypothetical protein PF008_g10056 [Phytophthora fragariae]|uniref:Secreted protein n=1 Tax=Phytophthora fragariae TaxID=53985 RepID=A0A6G0RUW7_9STRA|nr:hypothetical protein PF008_g10056 [Phytophthora fragariae]
MFQKSLLMILPITTATGTSTPTSALNLCKVTLPSSQCFLCVLNSCSRESGIGMNEDWIGYKLSYPE